jgi:hypothetical protein
MHTAHMSSLYYSTVVFSSLMLVLARTDNREGGREVEAAAKGRSVGESPSRQTRGGGVEAPRPGQARQSAQYRNSSTAAAAAVCYSTSC